MKSLVLAAIIAVTASVLTSSSVAASTTTIYQSMSKVECAKLLKAHPSIKRNVTINHLTLKQRMAQGCRRKITTHRVPNSRLQSPGIAGSNWIEIRGGFGIWTQKIGFGYEYNGNAVWVTWMSCTKGGMFYVVTINWCGAYNSGGEYMDIGSDFSVALILPQAPINRDFWQRERIDMNGNIGEHTGGPA